MWELPGPELEPVCPALAGGFLITVPPGKPPSFNFDISGNWGGWWWLVQLGWGDDWQLHLLVEMEFIWVESRKQISRAPEFPVETMEPRRRKVTFCKSHGQGQVRLNIPAPRPGPCPLDNPSLYVIALPFSTKNALDLRGVVTLNSGLLDPCSLSPLSPKRKRCLAGRRVALCGAGMASVLAPEPLCSPDFPGCSCAMWLLLLSYLVHRFQVLSTPLIHSIPLGDLIPPMSLSITYTLMIPTLISPVKASSLGFCIQVHPPRRWLTDLRLHHSPSQNPYWLCNLQEHLTWHTRPSTTRHPSASFSNIISLQSLPFIVYHNITKYPSDPPIPGHTHLSRLVVLHSFCTKVSGSRRCAAHNVVAQKESHGKSLPTEWDMPEAWCGRTWRLR